MNILLYSFRITAKKWFRRIVSKDSFTPAEMEDIEAYIRKRYTPPNWFIEGEEWEALGRPRSGKAYEEHTKKWDKIYNRT